jgi:hypothetical protein
MLGRLIIITTVRLTTSHSIIINSRCKVETNVLGSEVGVEDSEE